MRLARPEEAEAIRALVERAYAPYIPVIGRRPAPMDDDHAARIARGQAHVMERGGAIIALAVIEARADYLWIENLAVEPGLHGGGIGRALLAFAEAEARRWGLPELRLLTNARMERNRALYARAGFRETEEREENGLRRVYMARLLNPA
ncbi:GNAT family N-acetyltransferase [Pararoseomonas indoligenes]|uniref:GNAT family N-acetyltransferase n=1 Tax=Roseomonas indoligenes TaxID=2820811 RepID=A0A940MZ24_9PROT|nr:GNAT family N-acetyltransferase [Pararoseomonas indoligenes]MBP0491302.1 GNAT family N-acetyltransferase [Pararoseomonas indoligenes]